tara:strand:+ start:721 stop:915 length:195 start_codon:yes stop_codon:yes gene_type:complete
VEDLALLRLGLVEAVVLVVEVPIPEAQAEPQLLGKVIMVGHLRARLLVAVAAAAQVLLVQLPML